MTIDDINILDHFHMLDVVIAEIKLTGGHESLSYLEKQMCFLLSTSFIGDTPIGEQAR